MTTFWISLGLVLFLIALFVIRTYFIVRQYAPPIRRIFEESPIFRPTEGTPPEAGEEVEFQTPEGLTLRGTYLATTSGNPKGLIVFSHEYLSDRWSGVAYWEYLREGGFDVFAFDFRSHGTSDKDPAYAPRHWVTNYELDDLQAALAYVSRRSGTSRLPIGLFGISRGGGASIGVAARDRRIRCVVTDGAFSTHGTVLTYMRRWMALVVGEKWWLRLLPTWYLAIVRDSVLWLVERDFGCHFTRLERAVRQLTPRAILMIHGGRDSYIRPEIAREFFECARQPKEFWVVDNAHHNACLETAGEAYRQKVLGFFRSHLAGERDEGSGFGVQGSERE